MKRWVMQVSVGVAALGLTAAAQAATPGTATFDNDTEDWTANTTSATVVWTASGNPGGSLLSRKAIGPGAFDIGALVDQADDPDFGGDYAAAGIRKTGVDLNYMTDNIQNAWIRFRSGASVNGWRIPLANVFPTGSWISYDVMFDPTWSDQDARNAGWVTDEDVDPSANPSPTFASTLANVDTAEVRIQSPDEESTLVGIDNFYIDIPEPASLALLVLGGLGVVARRR